MRTGKLVVIAVSVAVLAVLPGSASGTPTLNVHYEHSGDMVSRVTGSVDQSGAEVVVVGTKVSCRILVGGREVAQASDPVRAVCRWP